MHNSPIISKSEYFDGIAEKWDDWQNQIKLKRVLNSGIIELGIGENESILDVGCGTGNLTSAILDNISPAGRIVAIDISSKMIELSKSKISDPRVQWHVASVNNIPLPDKSIDRVICFSVWPHIDNMSTALNEIHRVLKENGHLHIWHHQTRSTVNAIHKSIPLLHNDILVPAQQTADLLSVSNFSISMIIDTDEQYLVSGKKHTAPIDS